MSYEYIKFAENRLLNYENELKYANEEIAKHIVTKTFKERKERGEFTGRYGRKNYRMENQQKALELFK